MSEVFIDKYETQSKGDKLTLGAMKKRLPPCPICGRKAFIDHDIVDGYDFGYSAGCPVFRLNDGIHGITESYDPEAPRADGYSAKDCFDKWLAYCDRKQKEIGGRNEKKTKLDSE